MIDLNRLEYEIFLSYSHLDDLSVIEGQPGWVSNFFRILKIRLAVRLGKMPKVWWDRPELRGNVAFAEQIIAGLSSVAALIPILSPAYRESEWCERELKAFCEACERRGENVSKNRIFKVLKLPIDEQPRVLRDLLFYQFYREKSEIRPCRELEPPTISDPGKDYLDQIEELVCDIRDLLHPKPPAATVYLAESTSGLRKERTLVRRALKQRGYAVLPDLWLSPNGTDLKKQVAEYLKSCCLSVHLLGEMYGTIPEEESESIAALQIRLAAAHSGANPGFKRLIWLPPGLKPKEERQQRLIDELRGDPSGAEILQTSLQDLNDEIKERLKARKKMPVEPTAEDQKGLKRIYLVRDERDRDAIQEWSQYLFKKGFEVIGPRFKGNPAEIRQYHEENLALCNGVLLYWGQADDSWLQSKLHDLRRIHTFDRLRGHPLPTKAICLAPPPNPGKEALLTREAMVIKSLEGFSPEPLAPFLRQLENGQGGRAA